MLHLTITLNLKFVSAIATICTTHKIIIVFELSKCHSNTKENCWMRSVACVGMRYIGTRMQIPLFLSFGMHINTATFFTCFYSIFTPCMSSIVHNNLIRIIFICTFFTLVISSRIYIHSTEIKHIYSFENHPTESSHLFESYLLS